MGYKNYPRGDGDKINVALVIFTRVQRDGEGDSLAFCVHEWPTERESLVRCYKIDVSSRFRLDDLGDLGALGYAGHGSTLARSLLPTKETVEESLHDAVRCDVVLIEVLMCLLLSVLN